MKIIILKNLLIISVLSGLLSFYNCSSDEELKVTSLSIETNNIKQVGKISDLFSISSIIPLETNNKSLINRIDKIKVSKSNIFTFDRRSRKLLLFDIKGTFIRQVGELGEGPGEYIELMDFEIDPNNEIVYLLDFRKVHQFSFQGDFIKTNTLDFVASKIHMSSNYEFLFYGGRVDHRLLTTTPDFKLKDKFFPFSIAYALETIFPFSNFQSNTAFHLPTKDTVYKIVNGKPIAAVYIDFNGKNFTSHDFARLSESDKNDLFGYQKRNGYARLISFLPCQDYIFMSIIYQTSLVCLFNIKSGKYEFVNMKKIQNDIFGSFIPLYPKGVTDTEYIFAISPNKFIRDKTSSFYLSNIKILEGLTDYSNPVLVFAKPTL